MAIPQSPFPETAVESSRPDPDRALVEDKPTHVWILSAAQIASWGALYYTFAVISEPMQLELGWDKATINGAWSVALLLTGLSGFPIGLLLDRIGGRFVMTAGSLAGFVCLALWSTTHTIWSFYLICIGLGMAMSASLYEAGFAVLTQRYPSTYQKQISRMSLIGGLTPTIFIPLTGLLVNICGWRSALVVLSVVPLVVCFPIHFLLLKERISDGGRAPRRYRENAVTSNAALRDALRHPTFWLLLITFTIHSVLASAIIFHIIPLLKERNFNDATINGAYMMIGPAQIFGRFALIYLQQHFRMTTIGIVTFLAIPTALGMLIALPSTSATVFAVISLYGLGNGLYTIVRGTSVPDLLGLAGYGSINGAQTLVIRIGGATAPFCIALAWDRIGSYGPIVEVLLSMGVVAAVSYIAAVHMARRHVQSRAFKR